jgi:hypothetical protein
MDNWDFFEKNLKDAKNSTGALQKQAEIYGDSWQAAADRVKASIETIYSSLINEQVIISGLDTLKEFLDIVNGVVNGLGGLPGILTLVGVALTKVFTP